jgi:SAM-dependent methyltransferase
MIPLDQRTTLHLGAGRKYDPEAVNVDLVAATKPDIVHNLDQTPWPFPDNRFTEVWAYDVIEHLQDIIKTMEEIHRVCKPDATIKITVPHFSSSNAFTDVTHRHFFGRFSLDYFDPSHMFGFYSDRQFTVQKAQIIFRPSLMNKIVWRLANRFPHHYEEAWAWIFPAWFLSFELRVIKD